MNEQGAQLVASEILAKIVVHSEARTALYPGLVEILGMMEVPRCRLIVSREGGVKVYLLQSSSLLIVDVQSEPPGIDVGWVRLAEATLTRRCHDIEGKPNGIWWKTTWQLTSGSLTEEFVGVEGPRVVDDTEKFARAVARAVGWPLATAGST